MKRLWQDRNVVKELAISALLLPFAEMSLGQERAPWSERVVCSDAAPGGHGLAYARVPTSELAAWAQHACHKGDYSVLRGLYEHLRFDEQRASVMKKAELPLSKYRWSEISRPGYYRHITLEEALAHLWGLELRLHWPEELGARVLHLGENAAEVGASARRRSSTRRLNFLAARLRRRVGGRLAAVPALGGDWQEPGRQAVAALRLAAEGGGERPPVGRAGASALASPGRGRGRGDTLLRGRGS